MKKFYFPYSVLILILIHTACNNDSVAETVNINSPYCDGQLIFKNEKVWQQNKNTGNLNNVYYEFKENREIFASIFTLDNFSEKIIEYGAFIFFSRDFQSRLREKLRDPEAFYKSRFAPLICAGNQIYGVSAVVEIIGGDRVIFIVFVFVVFRQKKPEIV